VSRLPFRFSFLVLTLGCLAGVAVGQESPAASYAPLEQWRLAVAGGDAAALTQLFVTSQSPQIKSLDGKDIALQDEVNFWAGWKAKGLSDVRVEILQEQTPRPKAHVVIAQVTLFVKSGSATKKYYVGMAQGWVQVGEAWQLVYVQRQDAARLKQPMEQKDLYPTTADAKSEIAEAIHSATAARKRILVVFGANWCYDCHVLEEADVAKQYDVPLDRGVPALAVLESDGKLLFSQKRGEFEAARSMAPEDILDFLNKWKLGTRKN
jgi:thioredoxin 1